MNDLFNFRNLLKAHHKFYEFEQPKDLVIELTYDQVIRLGADLDYIIEQGGKSKCAEKK